MRAVNLRAGDLPGYAAQPRTPEGKSESEKRATRQFAACLGVDHGPSAGADPGSSELAEGSSPELARKEGPLRAEMIQSFVTVFHDAETSALVNRLFGEESAGRCISSYLRKILRGAELPSTLREGPIAVHQFAAPAHAFGWRIASYFAYRELTIPLELDMLGFSEGRGYVFVSAFALGGRFDPGAERHAVSLLMERARSHSA